MGLEGGVTSRADTPGGAHPGVRANGIDELLQGGVIAKGH